MSGMTKVQGVPMGSFVSQVVPEVVAAPFVARGSTGRSMQARAQDVVNVKDFGAPGSAGVDSAPGINAALAYVRSLGPTANVRVVFPADVYTLHQTINATGLQSPGIIIEGCGSTLVGAFGGGIVFDFFDTGWLKLRDITIAWDGVHSPTIGLAGGVAGMRPADGHAIENVFVEGNFSLACAYFMGTENSALRSLRCWNGDAGAGSYALVLDGVNHFGVSSMYAPQMRAADSAVGFSDMLFDQVDARKPNGGHAIWIGGVARHAWHASHVECDTPTQAVVLWASTGGTAQAITDLTLDLHQDSAAATDVFLVDGPSATPVIQGLSYRDHRPQAGSSIFRTAPQITSVLAQNLVVDIAQPAQAPVLFENPALWTVSGRLASPSSAELVNVAAGQFSGTLLTPAGLDGSAMHVTTGGAAARTLAQRATEVVNVKDYGAPGSAGGDSAPAINAALDAVRALGPGASAQVVFPADIYTVNAPLNFTGLLSENILIDGCGSRIVAAFDGGIVVDCFNSRWLRLRDLSIGTDGTHTPRLGLAMGRASGAQNADNHSVGNVLIDGNFQLAAAYLLATETSTFLRCNFWNGMSGGGAYALIADGINHFGVSSTFAPQTLPPDTLVSFNELLMINADIRNGGGTGHALWIGGSNRHKFITSYVEVNSATQAVVLYANIAGTNALNQELYLDLHQETTAASDVFLIDGAQSYALMLGFHYIDHNPQASNSVFKAAATVTSINAQGWELRLGSPAVSKIFDDPGVWSIVAGDVFLPDSPAPWNLPDSRFLGYFQSDNAGTEIVTTLDVSGAASVGSLGVTGAATIAGASVAVRPTMTVFDSSGNWTPKATSTVFWALIAGGGGGGGGGAAATTAQTASGGGGGGGGAFFAVGPVPVSALTGALSVTVGANGGGGAAGANGTAGGASNVAGAGFLSLYAGGGGGGGFGAVSVASAGGGGGCVADGTFASGANAAGATAGAGGTPNGQAGVAGTYVPFQTSLWGGSGGAGTPGTGGASGVQANTAHGATGGNSGQGVAANVAVPGIANSGSTLTASGNVGYGAAGLGGGGSGGSGGVGGAAGVADAAGGTGGAGGGPGGGGGGGGASAGGTGGTGGNGGTGRIIIVEV